MHKAEYDADTELVLKQSYDLFLNLHEIIHHQTLQHVLKFQIKIYLQEMDNLLFQNHNFYIFFRCARGTGQGIGAQPISSLRIHLVNPFHNY